MHRNALKRVYISSGVRHVVPRADPLTCERPDAWDDEKKALVRCRVSMLGSSCVLFDVEVRRGSSVLIEHLLWT